jgi:para-nitrobenzyl esterase
VQTLFRNLSRAAIGAAMTFAVTVQAAAEPVKVNALNFARAETDMYFGRTVKQAGGLGKFYHLRVPTPIAEQRVVRMNRDTLYSSAVFDLDAGPVTLTLPNVGKRFMSVLIVNQDHYAMETHYAPVKRTFTRKQVGTRYFSAIVRTFVDPNDPADVKAANAAQDAIRVEQAAVGSFEVPQWEADTHAKARDALLALAALGGTKDTRFGRPGEVDTISWLLGTAAGWGGNPPKDAIYEPVFPAKNDGATAYELTLKDVPVDGFWSVTVYDPKGFMFENPQKAYSVNNVTAKKGADGAYRIRFGGDPAGADNYLAIAPGWNYVLRLYRPRKPVLDGTWKAPQPQPLK